MVCPACLVRTNIATSPLLFNGVIAAQFCECFLF
jgi:hypothetical protein